MDVQHVRRYTHATDAQRAFNAIVIEFAGRPNEADFYGRAVKKAAAVLVDDLVVDPRLVASLVEVAEEA